MRTSNLIHDFGFGLHVLLEEKSPTNLCCVTLSETPVLGTVTGMCGRALSLLVWLRSPQVLMCVPQKRSLKECCSQTGRRTLEFDRTKDFSILLFLERYPSREGSAGRSQESIEGNRALAPNFREVCVHNTDATKKGWIPEYFLPDALRFVVGEIGED